MNFEQVIRPEPGKRFVCASCKRRARWYFPSRGNLQAREPCGNCGAVEFYEEEDVYFVCPRCQRRFYEGEFCLYDGVELKKLQEQGDQIWQTT